MGTAERLGGIIAGQASHLALWTPVFFALGIGVYFALPMEPSAPVLIAAGVVALAGGLMATRFSLTGRTLLLALALPLAGFANAGGRAIRVAAPVLPFEQTAAFEGRVSDLSRSGSNLPRITFDQVVIFGLEPALTPRKIRISIGEGTDPALLSPGKRLTGTARLSPPGGPSEPGGFDFRALAWFDQLGAVGYTKTPLLEAEGSETSWFQQIAFRARMALSARIQSHIPGQNGAFAAAIVAGDRSAMDKDVESDLRISTLYHLVSISGLHMSLVAAAIFAILRYGLALVPWCALHWPLKKIAAVAALIGAALYLVLAGMDVAALRSWLMTAVVLVAILLDRPALTLRSIALAGFIVLIFQPEALVQAGFQMSFAATIGLVAGFEALRGVKAWQTLHHDKRWRLVRPVAAAFMTSLIAGTVTGPFSAFHFNTIAHYGLIANLLAVPAMGIVVMPMAVAAMFLMPLGLDGLAFRLMDYGIGSVLWIAHVIAHVGGATSGVKSGPTVSLALIACGGVFLVLWQGRARALGFLPLALAFALWIALPRPLILIADNGRLFGVMTPEGRALSTDRGNGFAAEGWLENDGDRATQAEAAARGHFIRSRSRIETEVAGLGLLLYTWTKDPTAAGPDCARAAILIAPNLREPPTGSCHFIGAESLRREGGLSVTLTRAGPRFIGALSSDQNRPWNRPAPPREPPRAPIEAGSS